MQSKTEGQLPIDRKIVNDASLADDIEEERRLTKLMQDTGYNALVKDREAVRETIKGKLPIDPEVFGPQTFLVNEQDVLTVTRTKLDEHTVAESTRTRFKSEPAEPVA